MSKDNLRFLIMVLIILAVLLAVMILQSGNV